MGGSRKAEGGNETEDNFELLARDEFNKLSRQLRLMENDKRAYLKESNGALSHQKHVLEALELEKAELAAELEELHTSNSARDSALYAKIANSAQTYQKLIDKYEEQKLIAIKVKGKLKDASERVEDLRLCALEKEKEESPIPQLRHRIAIVKRKLETVTGKFDSIVAENAQSRQCVDEILQENLGILTKCGELEAEVEKRKVLLSDLVDQATFAYDQREEAVGKTLTILERNAKEKKQHLLEMSELARINRHEQKLLDFMSTKNRERMFLESSEDRTTRLEMAKEKVADEALESYMESFDKLLTDTSPKLSDLVDEYKSLYSSNVQRFQYINELNKEFEALQGTVGDLRDRIRRSTCEILDRNQTKNKIILSLLNRVEEVTKFSKEVDFNLAAVEGDMKNVLISASNLFGITSTSDNAQILKLLGSHEGICSENLILYLNIIEERFEEIFEKRKFEENGIFLSASEMDLRIRCKSPQPASRAGSRFSASSPTLFQSTIEKPCHYEILDKEPSAGPISYAKLREKVRDASATTASSGSEDESVVAAIKI